MSSIRTKITMLTVLAIIVSIAVATVMGVIAVKDVGSSSSEQILLLLSETGEKNLDAYFVSTQQSVESMADFVAKDLDGTDTENLGNHVDRARELFRNIAGKTYGALTYYYRIDPAVSTEVKGFWYTDVDGKGFVEHAVTNLAGYDTYDTSSLVWFTVPKATGKSIWLPPYVTENLDVRVISYNVPVYYHGMFVGVIGIEIDYSTLAEQVDHIELYHNGYAFLTDADGSIIYHPRFDVTAVSSGERPTVPRELSSGGKIVSYTYDGVEKQAAWLPLANGMRLYVTVPVSEINESWESLVNKIIIVSVIVLVVFILLTSRFASGITKPLRKLTEAAHRVNDGDYDVELTYRGNDEVGVLTATISRLISYLKGYIGDLKNLAYADALTSLRNKGAFDLFAKKIQAQIDDPDQENPQFAVGIFDCDDLKTVNDRKGHDKGDKYLKNASALICRVFKHSPVFRTGGDEFTVILQNEDYTNREELQRQFVQQCEETVVAAKNPWDKVSVAMGIAAFDPQNDRSILGVVRRADKLMYADKRSRKVGR